MATNKYRRTNFMNEFDIDGILEKDLVDNNWELFEVKRPMTFFTLGKSYIGRPDLLSIKLYGKENYWHLLLKANEEIEDIWNDLDVGVVINVPDVRDFEDFLALVKDRQK